MLEMMFKFLKTLATFCTVYMTVRVRNETREKRNVQGLQQRYCSTNA
jgi:hypothetical protein